MKNLPHEDFWRYQFFGPILAQANWEEEWLKSGLPLQTRLPYHNGTFGFRLTALCTQLPEFQGWPLREKLSLWMVSLFLWYRQSNPPKSGKLIPALSHLKSIAQHILPVAPEKYADTLRTAIAEAMEAVPCGYYLEGGPEFRLPLSEAGENVTAQRLQDCLSLLPLLEDAEDQLCWVQELGVPDEEREAWIKARERRSTQSDLHTPEGEKLRKRLLMEVHHA